MASRFSFRSRCPSPSSSFGASPAYLKSQVLFPSKAFRLKITCEPSDWIPIARKRLLKATRRKSLRNIILKASASGNKDILAGVDYVQEKTEPSIKDLDMDTILMVGEGACIAAATAAFIASLTNHRSHGSRRVASSTPEFSLKERYYSIPMWQNLFLLAAVLINAILRGRHLYGAGLGHRKPDKLVAADFAMEERVKKLEEELASAVTIIRVLSKQLEKLGVRFRVTRQTLRDPIRETATLAEKTAEAVHILAAREDGLEKGLEEIQEVLFGMQENQTKQLELISALARLLKTKTSTKVEKLRGIKDNRGKSSIHEKTEKSDGGLYKALNNKLGGIIKKASYVQPSESHKSEQQFKETTTDSGSLPLQDSALQGIEMDENAASCTLQGMQMDGDADRPRAVGLHFDNRRLSKVRSANWEPPQRVDYWHESSPGPSQQEVNARPSPHNQPPNGS